MTILSERFRLTDALTIPAVGFGTFLIEPGDAAAAVAEAIRIGYAHVDTAEAYGNEEAVGEGIRVGLADASLTRDDLFVTTKLWPGAAEWGEEAKSGAQTIAALDASLSRLGLDHIDLYLIHSPHGGAKRLEQWAALLELKRQGKARSVGVSNYAEDHLAEIRAAGLAAPDANQIELHPWSQKPALVAALRDAGILPIAYSSLAPLSTWRQGQTSAKTPGQHDDVLSDMARRYGVSEARLLLRWGVQSGYPVLPKSLNPARMRENIDLAGFAIDDADMATIRGLDRGDGLAWEMGEPTRVS